jgi:hypothetical protein
MKLEAEIGRIYDSVYATLTEYLRDEMDRVLNAIKKDKARLIKSWEDMGTARVKLERILSTPLGATWKNDSYSNYARIERKWGLKNSII